MALVSSLKTGNELKTTHNKKNSFLRENKLATLVLLLRRKKIKKKTCTQLCSEIALFIICSEYTYNNATLAV